MKNISIYEIKLCRCIKPIRVYNNISGEICRIPEAVYEYVIKSENKYSVDVYGTYIIFSREEFYNYFQEYNG